MRRCLMRSASPAKGPVPWANVCTTGSMAAGYSSSEVR